MHVVWILETSAPEWSSFPWSRLLQVVIGNAQNGLDHASRLTLDMARATALFGRFSFWILVYGAIDSLNAAN